MVPVRRNRPDRLDDGGMFCSHLWPISISASTGLRVRGHGAVIAGHEQEIPRGDLGPPDHGRWRYARRCTTRARTCRWMPCADGARPEGRLGILYSLAAAERARDDRADRSGSLDDFRRIMASYRSSWPARRDQLWEMFLRTLASSALWADFIKRRCSAA
jgi:hypothetical protein